MRGNFFGLLFNTYFLQTMKIIWKSGPRVWGTMIETPMSKTKYFNYCTAQHDDKATAIPASPK